jgi:hypothetical protein
MNSRLEEHESATLRNRMFALIGCLVLIGAMLYFVGIAPVINVITGVSSMFFSRQSTDLLADTEGALSIDPDTLPTATSSATLRATATVNNADTVRIYNGDRQVRNVTTKGRQEFRTSIPLNQGSNEIKFMAINENGRRESPVQVVLYLHEKPKITLEAPTSTSLTTLENQLMVKGSVEPNSATVTANKTPVVVDASGVFTYSANLKPGDNTLLITATDEAGQTTTETILVKREK